METQIPELAAVHTNKAVLSAATDGHAAPVAATPQGVTAAACPSCAAAQQDGQIAGPPPCIYVIGHIEPRFPQLSIEKEARQATARAGAGGTDREVMARLLQDPANKYLVRRLCWVLSVQGVETYMLVPRDGDYQPLVDAYRAEPKPGDLELVIGVRGPLSNPDICNGLIVPIVIFDQIYAFDRDTLLRSIPRLEKADPEKFIAAAAAMLDRILEQSDNAGATDADRALNYLAVRYDRIYSLAAEQFAANTAFTAIDVLPSRLSGTRRIVDVVFSFTDRATDVVSKFFTRVDVTECFPFLVTKMSPYYDR
jgi:hypothetical protein